MTIYAALGAVEQGFVYGIMVIGVYLTFRILDCPDLTVDGSLPLGAAISAVAITSGVDPYVSLLFALAGGCGGKPPGAPECVDCPRRKKAPGSGQQGESGC